MKALGIPQPGTWLVVNGYYSTVPLPAPTDYCGSVFIYALPDPVSPEDFEAFLLGCRQLRVTGHPRITDFELGGFIGTAELVGCEESDSGQIIGILENAVELGFVPSEGGFGLFEVIEDPFEVSTIPRVSYEPYTFAPASTRSKPNRHPARVKRDGRSIGDHFAAGFENQVYREARKAAEGLGRAAAKDALRYGAEFLTSWLGGGGKPTGGKRKR